MPSFLRQQLAIDPDGLRVELRLAIVARGRNDVHPRPGRNIVRLNEAPSRRMIVVHAEVMPHGGGHIESGSGIESVTRLGGIAEDKTEIVLAAGSDILPLGEARPASQHNLDPVVLEKRTHAVGKPRYVPGAALEPARRGKLAIGQGKVKGILLRLETNGPVSASALGVVDPTVMVEPTHIPIALVVRDEGVLFAGRFAHPEQSRHGSFEGCSRTRGQNKAWARHRSQETSRCYQESAPQTVHAQPITREQRSIRGFLAPNSWREGQCRPVINGFCVAPRELRPSTRG